MPNWVKNIIHIEGPAESISKAVELMRDKDDPSRIDFNNIVPMPERLNIVSGGYDKWYVALYLNTLGEAEKRWLRLKLVDRKVSFYGNYANKYKDSFDRWYNMYSHLNRMRDRFKEDYANLSPATMEDVGKAYIDNILECGHDSWYEWCRDSWGTKWNPTENKIGEDYLEFETAWSAPFPVIKALSTRFPELTFHHEWADEDLGRNCGKHAVTNGETLEYEFESDDEAHSFACVMWGYDPDEEEEE